MLSPGEGPMDIEIKTSGIAYPHGLKMLSNQEKTILTELDSGQAK